MSAVRRYPQEVVEAVLAPFRCNRVREIEPGFDLWVTGWGHPFTMCVDAEGGVSDIHMSAVLLDLRAMMPAGWNGNGG